ncbi:MAG: GNAT family N-acetyltransferase [Candidatus Izemoplasmatales bacterium]|jgi:ribosomal protein S18 acetylase RimI-like enzyme
MEFDQSIHNSQIVAGMIYDTDPQINQMLFGDRITGISLITKLMEQSGTFYATPYLRVIKNESGIVGIISFYSIKQKAKLHLATGKAYYRLFGGKLFVKKLPILLKLNHLFGGVFDKSGSYVVYLFVQESERRQGFASQAINELSKIIPKIYLHVASDNIAGIRFYENNGFINLGEHHIKIKKQDIKAYLMCRSN